MADKRSRDPGAAEDALAAMNDHLARFFQHADRLLDEWKTYGDQLRATLDSQARELGATVAGAVSEAGRAAAGQLDSQIDRAVAQSVDASIKENLQHSMDELRRQLDDMARLAGHSAPRAQAGTEPGRPARAAARGKPRSAVSSGIFLLALTTANVMLAVLLIMNVHRCTGSDEPARPGAAPAMSTADAARPDSAPGDAGPAPDSSTGTGSAGATQDLCATLAEGYDPDAAKAFFAASAQALCSEQSALPVTETLMSRMPADAGSGSGSDSSKKSGGGKNTSGDKKTSGKKNGDKKTSGHSKKSDSKKSDSKKSDSK